MSVRKLAPALREIRIHLCQNSESSKGVRDFIEQYYTQIKYENPKLPILIRECSGVQPKLWARFSYGKEKCVPLSDKDAECVLQEVGNLAPPC